MIHFMCAIRDRALDSFMRPFPAPTVGAAIRSFQDEMNREGSEMAKHPDDYDLYTLAKFDDESGKFVEELKQVAIGKNMISKERA